ncbi:MAG: Flagellar basal body-associated protein [Desulfotomaculum sp. 46_296]|nr:MAG: Flagellar basal body-associated protein [Desulfotomaculum sp. 46_296]HAU32315.1 hypothetical protein [Desulfotomaculum sp.]
MARRVKEPSESEPGIQETSSKKPKKIKLFIAAGLILFLIAGSAVYICFNHGLKSKIVGLKQNKKNAEQTVALSSLVVNLSGSGQHFVRISCVLVFPESNKKLAAELEEKNYILSDTLIKTLRGKTAEEIQRDPASKALKENLRQAINTQLTEGQISGVYFAELLVQ